MLSKCSFSGAIKQAAVFFNDTLWMQPLEVLASFVAVLTDTLLSSHPSLLNSCPSFLMVLSHPSFSLWIARIIF